MAQKPDETLLRADTFTNVPKVSRRTLTKEEREELAKQQAAETKEAVRAASPTPTVRPCSACCRWCSGR